MVLDLAERAAVSAVRARTADDQSRSSAPSTRRWPPLAQIA
ncbi:hypothetical protein ACFQHO_35485 [Actinomadura yumaensis]